MNIHPLFYEFDLVAEVAQSNNRIQLLSLQPSQISISNLDVIAKPLDVSGGSTHHHGEVVSRPDFPVEGVHGSPVDNVAAGVDGYYIFVVEGDVFELVFGLEVAYSQQEAVVLDVFDGEPALVSAEGEESASCYFEVVLGIFHAFERLLVQEVHLLVLLQTSAIRLESVVLDAYLCLEGIHDGEVVVFNFLQAGLHHILC